MPVEENTLAPDFVLLDENEINHSLSDFRGGPVVLYFYPKDDTPGCTIEACNFRDDYSAYQNANVTIIGVSPDTPGSHRKFKEKFSLPFTLLADQNHKIAEMYGAWGKKQGRENEGILRTTYLIDGNGFVLKVFENVSPAQHSAEVLDALK